MKECFCTIISEDFKPMALAMFRSMNKVMPEIYLQILVVSANVTNIEINHEKIKITSLEEIQDSDIFKLLYQKYAFKDPDFMRWSLKPVYVSYLLRKEYDKVCYVDCDMFFLGSHAFIFDELDKSNVLLSPHGYQYRPQVNESAFKELLHNGYFNAGLIACNKEGLPSLEWWAEACLFKMGKHAEDRIYDDQRYLDYIPILFPGVKIIEHAGCNLGAASFELYKREIVSDKIVINGKYPLISVHFNKSLIMQIIKGYEPALTDCLEMYRNEVENAGGKLEDFVKIDRIFLQPTIAMNIKWRLRIRTRIKKVLNDIVSKF